MKTILKSYLRRAISRSKRGNYVAAIADIDEALKISPDNVEAISIRHETFAKFQEAEGDNAMRVKTIQEAVAVAAEATKTGMNENRSENETAATDSDNTFLCVEAEVLRKNCRQDNERDRCSSGKIFGANGELKIIEVESDSDEDANELEDNRVAVANTAYADFDSFDAKKTSDNEDTEVLTEKNVDLIGVLKDELHPQYYRNTLTSYEFEGDWKCLKADAMAWSKYVKSIPPSVFPTIFANVGNPGILPDLFRALNFLVSDYPQEVYDILDKIKNIPRLKLLMKLFSHKEKDGIFESISLSNTN
ncbi:hypothetical protein HK100_001386 [Physocladia obscura]|uniref:RNA-polymerase II-associated protein 3-like C-terminal domain-containing protein n=1 Tax=Physocladia obscura TaxID=109957 RepID=A0AAD5XIJ4_9FUNG|nr:hypothetical protein HK100_001386 [Physocladia obscura]